MTINESIEASESRLQVVRDFAKKHSDFLAGKRASVDIGLESTLHLHDTENEARAYFGNEGWEDKTSTTLPVVRWASRNIDGVEVVLF